MAHTYASEYIHKIRRRKEEKLIVTSLYRKKNGTYKSALFVGLWNIDPIVAGAHCFSSDDGLLRTKTKEKTKMATLSNKSLSKPSN